MHVRRWMPMGWCMLPSSAWWWLRLRSLGILSAWDVCVHQWNVCTYAYKDKDSWQTTYLFPSFFASNVYPYLFIRACVDAYIYTRAYTRIHTCTPTPGNLNDLDGCSRKCEVEPGWVCGGGSPTNADTCVRDVCGDGRRIPAVPARSGNHYSSCKELKLGTGAIKDGEYWLYVNGDPEVVALLCASADHEVGMNLYSYTYTLLRAYNIDKEDACHNRVGLLLSIYSCIQTYMQSYMHTQFPYAPQDFCPDMALAGFILYICAYNTCIQTHVCTCRCPSRSTATTWALRSPLSS